MTHSSLADGPLLAISPRALHSLRDAVGAEGLQDAGFACGEAMHRAFVAWLPGATGISDPGELAATRLADVLSGFFTGLGWGSVTVGSLGETALAVDAEEWPEATPERALEYPSCYFTSGLLADLMGRVAGETLAAMEVECRSRGDAICRWLVASPETLNAVYEQMGRGVSYGVALGVG
jgi:predicted hydrocarbon binding protein